MTRLSGSVKANDNPIVRKRSAGVLMHLSSLDGSCGIGDLGPCSHEFAEWCAQAGLGWWQMLPVGPIGPGDSPYASTSTFAGEALFVSLEGLVQDGLLSRRDLREAAQAAGRPTKTNYAAARQAKEPAFLRAFEVFKLEGGFETPEYRAFVRAQRAWLPGWLAFSGGRREFHAFTQFQFDRQWNALHLVCARAGVRLLGDLPIFVTLDGADVQDHPELFRLDAKGKPEVLTGVGPDCFSRDGQLWGHPHYRWSAHRAESFNWWTSRIGAALSRFDGIRVDHFIGFHHAYEIDRRAKTARSGVWRPQRGREVLLAARKKFGTLALLAEDLGAVTPEVTALRKEFALPGMRVLHHAFGTDDSEDLPHRHPSNCVVYTGTHDNDTTVGWYGKLGVLGRQRLRDYCGSDSAREPARALTRLAFESPAQLAIVPMQDLLGLPASARMNLPGSPQGNWCWRIGSGWHRRSRALAKDLRRLIALTGRMP